MNILFLTDNFVPETNAPAHRTYEHAKQWVEKGVNVTVLTCAPNFPFGKVYEGYKNKLYQVEYIEGIKVVRVWSYMAENKGFFKRVLDFCSYMLSSFVAGFFIKTDLIVATSPQFFTAISGRWLAFWKRKKWIMEVRDLWPESIKVVGAMKNNPIIRFFEFLEHRLYVNAHKIVTVTNYMQKEITSKHNLPASKVAVIKNGVDFDQFSALPKDQNLISILGLKEKFIVGYIGTHGMAHGLDFILKSAANVANDEIHFLFVGSGAEKPKLLEMRKELNLKNVTFLDPVPKAEVKKYISILDFGLVNLIDSPVFHGALPSKINELVAMKKPILLGVKGEAAEFITKNTLGICYHPENEESFLNALEMAHKMKKFEVKSDLVRPEIDRKALAFRMLDFIKD